PGLVRPPWTCKAPGSLLDVEARASVDRGPRPGQGQHALHASHGVDAGVDLVALSVAETHGADAVLDRTRSRIGTWQCVQQESPPKRGHAATFLDHDADLPGSRGFRSRNEHRSGYECR